MLTMFLFGVFTTFLMLVGIALYMLAQKKESDTKQLQFSNWGD